MSIFKQIACIAAYSAGFAIGTYGAVKIVDAIDSKYPMKKHKSLFEFGPCRVVVKAGRGKENAEASITYANGHVEKIKGTRAEVNAQLKEYGLDQYAVA